MRGIRKILAPTDFSETSSAAVHYALDLARSLAAEVTLFHVVYVPVYVYPGGGPIFSLSPEATAGMMRAAEQSLAETARRADRTGGHVAVQVVEGTPAERIIRAVEGHGYDLIVMGTHGRSGVRHLLLGSVAERVLRAADCPVLTVSKRSVDQERAT